MRDGRSSFTFGMTAFFCGALSAPVQEKDIPFWAQVPGSGYSVRADWCKMRAGLFGSIGTL